MIPLVGVLPKRVCRACLKARSQIKVRGWWTRNLRSCRHRIIISRRRSRIGTINKSNMRAMISNRPCLRFRRCINIILLSIGSNLLRVLLSRRVVRIRTYLRTLLPLRILELHLNQASNHKAALNSPCLQCTDGTAKNPQPLLLFPAIQHQMNTLRTRLYFLLSLSTTARIELGNSGPNRKMKSCARYSASLENIGESAVSCFQEEQLNHVNTDGPTPKKVREVPRLRQLKQSISIR